MDNYQNIKSQKIITKQQVVISAIIGIAISILLNSGSTFGKLGYYVYIGNEKIEITREKYENIFEPGGAYIISGDKRLKIETSDIIIVYKTDWENIFYGLNLYVILFVLLICFVFYNKFYNSKVSN